MKDSKQKKALETICIYSSDVMCFLSFKLIQEFKKIRHFQTGIDSPFIGI